MAVVGMDPKPVYPASSKLENASTTLNHAVTAAMGALDNPGDIPQDFVSRAMAIGGQARGCLTSADAFAMHSVDLLDRARLFEELERYAPLTDASRGAALDHFKLLWNPAGRHQSLLQPGSYYNEIDTILHPENHQPRAPTIKSGCVKESGGEGSLDLPGIHVKKTLNSGQVTTTRSNFNQPGKDGEPDKEGRGRAPLGGSDRPDLQSNKGKPIFSSTLAGRYEVRYGYKCTTNLGHGYYVVSEPKVFSEIHAQIKTEGGTGGMDGSGGVGATAGVKDTETLHTPYGTVALSAAAQGGASADGGWHLQLDHGRLRAGWKISRTLGLGGSSTGDVDLDVAAILGLKSKPKITPGLPVGSHGANGAPVITDALKGHHGG